jgi:hypothetical protein
VLEIPFEDELGVQLLRFEVSPCDIGVAYYAETIFWVSMKMSKSNRTEVEDIAHSLRPYCGRMTTWYAGVRYSDGGAKDRKRI